MGEEAHVIELPADALVMLIGPAASGKSAFAARHFRESQVVSSDRCRELICDDPGNQSVSGRAFDLFHFLIRHRLQIARLTVADSTALEAAARRQLREMARACGRPVVAIVFDAALTACLARDAARRRVVGPEAIARQAAMMPGVLAALPAEGYAGVYVLGDTAAARAAVRIAPAPSAGPGGPRPAQASAPGASSAGGGGAL